MSGTTSGSAPGDDGSDETAESRAFLATAAFTRVPAFTAAGPRRGRPRPPEPPPVVATPELEPERTVPDMSEQIESRRRADAAAFAEERARAEAAREQYMAQLAADAALIGYEEPAAEPADRYGRISGFSSNASPATAAETVAADVRSRYAAAPEPPAQAEPVASEAVTPAEPVEHPEAVEHPEPVIYAEPVVNAEPIAYAEPSGYLEPAGIAAPTPYAPLTPAAPVDDAPDTVWTDPAEPTAPPLETVASARAALLEQARTSSAPQQSQEPSAPPAAEAAAPPTPTLDLFGTVIVTPAVDVLPDPAAFDQGPDVDEPPAAAADPEPDVRARPSSVVPELPAPTAATETAAAALPASATSSVWQDLYGDPVESPASRWDETDEPVPSTVWFEAAAPPPVPDLPAPSAPGGLSSVHPDKLQPVVFDVLPNQGRSSRPDPRRAAETELAKDAQKVERAAAKAAQALADRQAKDARELARREAREQKRVAAATTRHVTQVDPADGFGPSEAPAAAAPNSGVNISFSTADVVRLEQASVDRRQAAKDEAKDLARRRTEDRKMLDASRKAAEAARRDRLVIEKAESRERAAALKEAERAARRATQDAVRSITGSMTDPAARKAAEEAAFAAATQAARAALGVNAYLPAINPPKGSPPPVVKPAQLVEPLPYLAPDSLPEGAFPGGPPTPPPLFTGAAPLLEPERAAAPADEAKTQPGQTQPGQTQPGQTQLGAAQPALPSDPPAGSAHSEREDLWGRLAAPEPVTAAAYTPTVHDEVSGGTLLPSNAGRPIRQPLSRTARLRVLVGLVLVALVAAVVGYLATRPSDTGPTVVPPSATPVQKTLPARSPGERFEITVPSGYSLTVQNSDVTVSPSLGQVNGVLSRGAATITVATQGPATSATDVLGAVLKRHGGTVTSPPAAVTIDGEPGATATVGTTDVIQVAVHHGVAYAFEANHGATLDNLTTLTQGIHFGG